MGFFKRIRRKAKKSLRRAGLTKRNLKTVNRLVRPAVRSIAAMDPRAQALISANRARLQTTRMLKGRTRRAGLGPGVALDTIGNILLSPPKAHAPARMITGPPALPGHTAVAPISVTPGDPLGRDAIVPVTYATRRTVPPGYVVVEYPKNSGNYYGMLKDAARRAKLWKPRRKPPISAGDWRHLQVAERVKTKAKKIGQAAGYSVTAKGSRRGTRRTTCK